MGAETWIKATEASALPPGQMVGVEVGGKALCIYNVDGQFYATSNICRSCKRSGCDLRTDSGPAETLRADRVGAEDDSRFLAPGCASPRPPVAPTSTAPGC